MRRPVLFVSHGSPMLALTETPAGSFLAGLAAGLPHPRAILVVSAHWEAGSPMISAVARNETIHDFFGFPRALYELAYPAPGDPSRAQRIAGLLGTGGFPTELDRTRGQIGSHNLLTTPSRAAFADRDLRPLIDKYLRGVAISAEQQARLFRLLWDFAGTALASRNEHYECSTWDPVDVT